MGAGISRRSWLGAPAIAALFLAALGGRSHAAVGSNSAGAWPDHLREAVEAGDAGRLAEVLEGAEEESLQARDSHGATLLHVAASRGHAAAVELLLAGRSVVVAGDAQGRTPLHEAAEAGHVEVLEVLLARAGANVSVADELGWTPLHWAALRGGAAAAERLLAARAAADAREHWGCTPLHWAARRGHVQLLQLLLAQGANASAVDGENRTAARWARLTGHDGFADVLEGISSLGDSLAVAPASPSSLLDAARVGNVSAVRQALAAGASAGAKDEWGCNALHVAAEAGHEAVLAVLLGEGGSLASAVAEADRWGRTPLLAAAQGRHGHAAVVSALLRQRASVHQADADGRSALHWAALRGHAALVKHLLGQNADLGGKDRWGRGLAHHAAANGHASVLKALIKQRALPGEADYAGQAPLHLAAAGGHAKVVKALGGAGAAASAADELGRTPLHYAALMGHAESVSSLLSLGASINAADRDGATPLALAQGAPELSLHKDFPSSGSVAHRLEELVRDAIRRNSEPLQA